MAKFISFAGVEKGDFVYFLSLMLSRANKSVLLIDNSFNKDIYNAVTNFTEIEYVIKENIGYVKNIKIIPEEAEDIDYIIYWHGMNINDEILNFSDYIYVISNFEPHVIKKLNEKITQKENINKIIIRDYVGASKISSTTLAGLLHRAKEDIAAEIVLDIKDYEIYLSFIYNGRQKISNLSPNYIYGLKEITKDILQISDKELNKILNKAKKIRK